MVVTLLLFRDLLPQKIGLERAWRRGAWSARSFGGHRFLEVCHDERDIPLLLYMIRCSQSSAHEITLDAPYSTPNSHGEYRDDRGSRWKRGRGYRGSSVGLGRVLTG